MPQNASRANLPAELATTVATGLARAWRALAPRRFTHVVPLGLSCRVTYQVRRYFRSAVAYPFDWWVSPLPGLAAYLAQLDPQRIYGPGALREIFEDGRLIALENREFGVRPFHEFPRRRDGAVSVVDEGWREHLPVAAAKHEERLDRLLALDSPDNRVLFVRHRFDVDSGRVAEQPAIDALWASLCQTFRRCEVNLLMIQIPGIAVPRSDRCWSLTIDDLPAAPPEAWRGADSAWDAGLRSLRLRTLHTSFPATDAAWLAPST
ncbi:MAG: hypothetical protein ABI609_12750 [Acidobacteriota bacterium]